MALYDKFQVGGVLHPLPISSPNSLLQDADPALFFSLDFWSWVIGYYPGPRLVQALAAANVTAPQGAAIQSAIAQCYPYEPKPEYLETQIQFPALFAYRTRSRTEQWTAGYEHDVTSFELYYVLPPLDAAGAEQILPALPAIAQALRKKTSDAWDPNYSPPGGVTGAQFDAPAYANLQEVGFGEWGNPKRPLSEWYRIGQLPGTGDLWFPSLMMNGFFVEEDQYVKTGGTYQGMDANVLLVAPDGTQIPFAKLSTQNGPTLTSIAPTSGSVAGGTSVTLTGTNFLSGAQGQLVVMFGSQVATSVVWASPTSINCVTSTTMLGTGTVGVTVVQRDGTSANLPASFTFQ